MFLGVLACQCWVALPFRTLQIICGKYILVEYILISQTPKLPFFFTLANFRDVGKALFTLSFQLLVSIWGLEGALLLFVGWVLLLWLSVLLS